MDNNKSLKIEYLCIAFFLISVIVLNVMIKLDYSFEYMTISLSELKGILDRNSIGALLQISLKRLKQYIFLFLLIKVTKKDTAINCVFIILSIILGIFMTVNCYYFGLSGIVEIIVLLCPHFIAYYILLKLTNRYIRLGNVKELKNIVTLSLLFVTGMLCEVFFSKIFLGFFINILYA